MKSDGVDGKELNPGVYELCQNQIGNMIAMRQRLTSINNQGAFVKSAPCGPFPYLEARTVAIKG